MTLEELGRLQAAFGAQISAPVPDATTLAPWLASDAVSADRLARYASALRAHRAGSLAALYPVLHALAGADYFATMAAQYGAAHPSQESDLARFGARLAGFLAAWPHARAHRYFADVARLEWLLHSAHGASNVRALSAHDVQGAADFGEWTLSLHASAALFDADSRAAAIWLAHSDPARHGLPESPDGTSLALVYRHGWKPCVRELDAGEARALAVLGAGATLGAALEAALEGSPQSDPAALFTRWLSDAILVRAPAAHQGQGQPPVPHPVASIG